MLIRGPKKIFKRIPSLVSKLAQTEVTFFATEKHAMLYAYPINLESEKDMKPMICASASILKPFTRN